MNVSSIGPDVQPFTLKWQMNASDSVENEYYTFQLTLAAEKFK